MGDTSGGGSSGFLKGAGIAVALLIGAGIGVNGWLNITGEPRRPFFSNVFPASSAPSPQSWSGVGVPAPNAGAAGGCVRVTDATPVQNTMCRQGDQQLSWRGRQNYCLPPRPAPNSYVCFNSARGVLSWYSP